jgi:hypothetical protein
MENMRLARERLTGETAMANPIGNWQAIYHHIWAALTIHLGVAAQDEG